MNKDNRQTQALWILAATIVILNVWAFLDFDVTIGGFTLKKVNLFSNITKNTQKDGKNGVDSTVSFAGSMKSVMVDSLAKAKLKKKLPSTQGTIEFAPDSAGGMTVFFKSLQQTKKGKHKTRIAYFGDSMIEGDLLTRELRELLQSRFGGKGVGFVPITSPVAGFRQTIIQTFSTDWAASSFTENNKPDRMIGIAGYVFNPLIDSRINAADSSHHSFNHSWVKYNACPTCFNAKQFDEAYLYYGKGNPRSFINYTWGIEDNLYKPLDGAEDLNRTALNTELPAGKCEVNFFAGEKINVYGLSFESADGVLLDNYSFRGNSGLAFSVVPYKLMRDFAATFEYDLIIVHYGLNVIAKNQKDFSWYERGMKTVMKQFTQCFPKSSILMVSVNDKSTKVNGEMETDIGVPVLVETQKRLADSAHVSFWNLYEAMGGHNSMVAWATADTALANKDYTHLNYRGAAKVANMLYKELINGYDDYEKKHK